jgi:hypothetical protein
MKVCTKCKKEKDKTFFGKDTSRKDLLNPWCKECKRQASLVYKAENKEKIAAYYLKNKDKVSALNAAWRAKNKEKIIAYRIENKNYYRDYQLTHKEEQKDWRRRKLYGISNDDFREILEIQENKCLICKELFSDNNLPHVDHCHCSGELRGILCGTCNRALGLFKDRPDLCRAAADYLEIYKNLLTTDQTLDTLGSELFKAIKVAVD